MLPTKQANFLAKRPRITVTRRDPLLTEALNSSRAKRNKERKKKKTLKNPLFFSPCSKQMFPEKSIKFGQIKVSKFCRHTRLLSTSSFSSFSFFSFLLFLLFLPFIILTTSHPVL
jgi:hypothetical protein